MKHLKLAVTMFLSIILLCSTHERVKQVLIIGDSISIGYTPFIEKALAPGAVVTHNPGNGGSTVRGIENIEKWIDNREWDVIVFNFGLHDLVHKDQNNKYDINGNVAVSLEEYGKNLEIIVSKLKETTARLIFVTTTMVPENAAGRLPEDPAKYNKEAMEVMLKNNIEVVDLYQASLSIHPNNSNPGNVHYTPAGYELLATSITGAIKKVLNK